MIGYLRSEGIFSNQAFRSESICITRCASHSGEPNPSRTLDLFRANYSTRRINAYLTPRPGSKITYDCLKCESGNLGGADPAVHVCCRVQTRGVRWRVWGPTGFLEVDDRIQVQTDTQVSLCDRYRGEIPTLHPG
jgi:hypothetical protein